MSLNTSIRAAAQAMRARHHSYVVVQQAGEILGVFSESGVVIALTLKADVNESIPPDALVPVPVLPIDADLALAIGVLRESRLGWCPVVDRQGQVCGSLSCQRLGDHHQNGLVLGAEKDQPSLMQLFPEIKFQAIFEQINVGICQATLDGRLVDANPGLCRMLGYSRDDLVQKNFQQLTHPEDINLDLKQYEQLLLGKQSSMFVEKRYLHRDGHAIWVALTVCLVRDAQGKPLFSIGVSQDISDRKAAELALQTSHQHVFNILESITDAFFALDHCWCFTYLNQRAEQLLQQPRHGLLGQNIWQQFPEMLENLFFRKFQEAMEKREGTRFEEFVKLTSSWYEAHVYPTQEGLAVYFQDITDRKQTYQRVEHQIRREQALNRVIQAIRKSLNLENIFETAAVAIANLLQADQVAIQSYSPGEQCWRVVAEHRADESITSLLHLVVPDDDTAISARLKRLEVVQMDAADSWADLKGILPGRWLLMPLNANGPLLWGCLGIRRARDFGPWQATEIDLVRTVADQLAIAIQQAQTLEQAQRELQERQLAETRLKEAQRIAHTGSWELELPSGQITWSEEMYRIFGVSLQSRPLSLQEQIAALDERDRSRWHAQIMQACEQGQTLDLEGCLYCADGNLRFVHLRGRPQRNSEGTISSLVGTLTDISERKLIEERLFYDARHDSLTGIPNRTYFMEQLNAAVELAKSRPELMFSVLFIDLDRFKVINDSLGHLVGDRLLVECAERLSSVVREGDLVARLGGDEFAILLDHANPVDDALTVANRIHEVLQVPLVLDGQEIFISASIGISSNWTGAIEAVDFLRDADTAMYQAKNNGRGCSALFDPGMYEQVTTQLTLENDLQRALQRQELALHYQPIVNLRSGLLVGFEALVRWHNPRWGYISPATFIPLAEETGLILTIGEWTQQVACQQLHQWKQRYPQAADLTMSVNLSVKQFGSSRLISTIDKTLAATGLGYHDLHLEITESALIDNPETAESILSALRERGIQLCIDDFGTGYSSLSMVHQFPVQVLKIDRSFTNRIEADHRGVAMVQSILGLAHNLGMTAIAEGVETASQLQHLKDLHCPFAQGYYFSKPLPATEAEQLFQNWSAGGTSTRLNP